jgi:hypothetical protein
MVSNKKNDIKSKTNNKNTITVADRDLKLIQLEEEIKRKKELLIKKMRELEKKTALNEYLEIVKEEYNNYYNEEVEKKKKELSAMTVLSDYMKFLENQNHLADNHKLVAKHDKKEILHEINKIKKELDKLVAN